ncbi:MAG TPA: hypothetical protein VNS88_09900 [Nitrospiraceae bacterium]|nr:hypothetical protein [Nitrospiraceae bacterium]
MAPRQRNGVFVGLKPDEYDVLLRLCKFHGITLTDFARAAVWVIARRELQMLQGRVTEQQAAQERYLRDKADRDAEMRADGWLPDERGGWYKPTGEWQSPEILLPISGLLQ